MYYALIILSVIIFGGNFALKDIYRKLRGNSVRASLEFSFVGGLAGLVIMLIINGFKWELTPFTIIMALASIVNGYLFTYCSFKALGVINLSLYSVYSMLGGMALPFIQGILFYNERLTLAKVVCFVLICVAIFLTLKKGESKRGTIYYAGVFVLNGLSGVITKIYTAAPFEKASAEGFSLVTSVFSIIISFLILVLFFKPERNKGNQNIKKSISIGSACSALNKIANLLLMVALAHVDASVQYPMVTGGVMIVSTIICLFGKNKPSKREILSVIVAFLGMFALFSIPV